MVSEFSARAFSSSFFFNFPSQLLYIHGAPLNPSFILLLLAPSSIVFLVTLCCFHSDVLLEILRRFRSFLYNRPSNVKFKDVSLPQGSYVFKQESHLTVLKTSLFFAGDGFTVYNSLGELVFRVDSYGPQPRLQDHQVVLMDPRGRCLLTVRRKRPSLHQRWEGFSGERMDCDKPIFCVKRSSMIGRSKTTVTVEVYDGSGEEYQIEGCFSERSCKIYNGKRKVVAEIRRKVDPTTRVILGKEVFSLCVKPGFDGAFAMGLVLVLDQMNDDNYINSGAPQQVVHPSAGDY